MKKLVATAAVIIGAIVMVMGYYFIPDVRTAGNTAISSAPNVTSYPSFGASIHYTPVLLIFVPIVFLCVGLFLVWVWKRRKTVR